MELKEFYRKSVEVRTQLCLWGLQSPRLGVGKVVDQIDDELQDITILYSTEFNINPPMTGFSITTVDLVQGDKEAVNAQVIAYIAEYAAFLKTQVLSLSATEQYIGEEINDIIQACVFAIRSVKTD